MFSPQKVEFSKVHVVCNRSKMHTTPPIFTFHNKSPGCMQAVAVQQKDLWFSDRLHGVESTWTFLLNKATLQLQKRNRFLYEELNAKYTFCCFVVLTGECFWTQQTRVMSTLHAAYILSANSHAVITGPQCRNRSFASSFQRRLSAENESPAPSWLPSVWQTLAQWVMRSYSSDSSYYTDCEMYVCVWKRGWQKQYVIQREDQCLHWSYK